MAWSNGLTRVFLRLTPACPVPFIRKHFDHEQKTHWSCTRTPNESAEVFRRAVIGPPKKLVVTLIVLEEIYLLHS